jgi:serine/threonine protein kinase
MLSQCHIGARIGAGGMGTVYRARDTRLGREVAIKVINAEIAADPDRIARFHREARTVAALNHPGILTIHDTGQADGITYLVTEFVDGTTVRTLLEREGALGHRRVIEIGSQVADALAAAPSSGKRETSGSGTDCHRRDRGGSASWAADAIGIAWRRSQQPTYSRACSHGTTASTTCAIAPVKRWSTPGSVTSSGRPPAAARASSAS